MAARYAQSRDESFAILRLVINRIGQHDAASTPTAFAVWYEHLSGINPRLSAALEAGLQAQARLDDATIERLHREYVADPDAQTSERISDDMLRLMHNLAESADQTGRSAASYSAQLGDLDQALREQDDSLTPRVRDTLAGTQQIAQAVNSLRDAVESSRQEIDQLRAELTRSRTEALTDPLTRIPNRKGFEQALGELLARPPADGRSHCLVMLDIDHFKRINDSHGHLVGDSVIQGLGEVLRRQTEAPGASCARYGGEEFAILLRDSSTADAARLAEAVRAMARAMKIRNRRTNEVIASVTVSAGVAAWTPGEDREALIAAADAALYRAKEGGRDRIVVA